MLLRKDLKVREKDFRNFYIATCEGSSLGIRVSLDNSVKARLSIAVGLI